MEDENHVIKKSLQKQDKLVRKTWDKKNEKLIKQIGVFKFKNIRKKLKSVSLKKCKSFMQQKVTKWKKK